MKRSTYDNGATLADYLDQKPQFSRLDVVLFAVGVLALLILGCLR